MAAADAPALSNRLSHLAHEVRGAFGRSAQAYLDAGRLLIEAKAECRHGDWLPFLAAAGVDERRARRAMRLARAGMTAEAIIEAGGIRAALEGLAKPRPKSVTVTDLPMRQDSPAPPSA